MPAEELEDIRFQDPYPEPPIDVVVSQTLEHIPLTDKDVSQMSYYDAQGRAGERGRSERAAPGISIDNDAGCFLLMTIALIVIGVLLWPGW